jgi:hypothetical protein
VEDNAMNDITKHCSIVRVDTSKYFPLTQRKNKVIDAEGNEMLLLTVKSSSAYGKRVAAQTKVLEQAVKAEQAKILESNVTTWRVEQAAVEFIAIRIECDTWRPC